MGTATCQNQQPGRPVMTFTLNPRIRAVLEAAYGLRVGRIRRVWAGTQTDNLRAELADDTSRFVKIYRTGGDLTYERQILDATMYLAQAGVPTTRLVRTTSGERMHVEADLAVSVWLWTDATSPAVLNVRQAAALGRATAGLHHVLDGLAAQRLPVSAERCRTTLPAQAQARCEHLLDLISARVFTDRTDHANIARLRQRITDLDHVGRLQDGLAPLRLRPAHGDLVTPNTLFAGDQLAAIIDLRLQHADRGRELGRMAFDPHTVAHRDDWQQISLAAVAAYLEAGGPATGDEVRNCARLALLHALLSTYGVEERYLAPRPARIQKSLDRYWADRHLFTRRLLQHLPQVEQQLTGLAAGMHSHGRAAITGAVR